MEKFLRRHCERNVMYVKQSFEVCMLRDCFVPRNDDFLCNDEFSTRHCERNVM
jgi:hypothetical protein